MQPNEYIDYIVSLIRAAITNTPAKYPEIEDFNWESLFKFGCTHRLSGIFYFAIASMPEEDRDKIPNLSSFVSAWKRELFLDANRQNESGRITKALSELKIDHMLLKGSVSRYLYPDTSMRGMSDVDILYKKNDHIDQVMKELGYEKQSESSKDTCYRNKTNNIYVELHRSLVESGFETEYKYLDTIWERVKNKKKYEYEMSVEDFYIYLIIHTSKHFRHGGIGIVPFVDIWLYINAKDMNWDHLKKEFAKLKLAGFEKYARLLVCKWFATHDDADKDFIFTPDAITEKDWEIVTLMERYVFSNSAFGTDVQLEVNKIIYSKKQGRKGSALLNRIFPERRTLANYYGEKVIKYPIFTPYYWFKLNLERLFSKNRSIKKTKELMGKITDERVAKTQYLFENIFDE